MNITIQDIERHLAANGYSVAATYHGSRVWRRRGGGADEAIGVPSGGERHADDLCLGRLVELGIPYVCDPETPGVYEDRPVAASGRLLGSVPIPNGYAPEMYETVEKIKARLAAPERCSLCTAVAAVHLPPELGASALCRSCADRVRAALVPPDEAERRQMEVLANLGCRASRVPPAPRCPCPDCSRG